MEETRKSRSSEAFFGRRKGPKLQGRKQRLIDEQLPKLALDLTQPCPSEVSQLFGTGPERLHLEIGFGGGEHLAHQATQNPTTGHMGVEPFINGMAKMLGEIDDRNLQNVRLFGDDATLLLDWLPPDSLDQVDLLYPDPWPKKRHWKRRFVNRTNLDRICRVLKPGGMFRFASDIETYVNWTLVHVHNQGQLQWQAKSSEDWNKPWSGWVRTRYEAKAIREGRTPCYLIFRLPNGS